MCFSHFLNFTIGTNLRKAFQIIKKSFHSRFSSVQAGNYMFKVNNRKTRTRCGICSKLTIKIPEVEK